MAKSPSGTRRTNVGKLSNARQDAVARAAIGPTFSAVSGSLAGSVGEIFRSARVAQRLSQDQVAEFTSGRTLEVSRATISAIERGANLPGLEVLVTLSRVLHVDPTEILERVELKSTLPVDLTGITREELGRRGEEAFWAGDYRRALAAYDAILQHMVLDPPADDGERTRLRVRHEVNRAATLRRLCALAASRAAAERAIALGDRFPNLQAQAYEVLAAVLLDSGKLPFARDAAEHAVRLASGCGGRILGMAWVNKGHVCFAADDYEGARTAFLEAQRVFVEFKEHIHLIHVEGNIGSCLLAQRRNALARKHFVTAVDLARKHGVPQLEASWLVELAAFEFESGQIEKAESYVESALRIAKPLDHILTIFRAEWIQHRIAVRRDPATPDRRRVSYLVKLYGRLGEHRGVAAVREFETELMRSSSKGSGRP